MTGQGELDLRPLDRSAQPSPRATGLSRPRLAGLLACALLLVWASWVTRRLAAPARDRIVSARLSTLVGEHVAAAARSAAPRAVVESEMRRFLATLDRELQRRSAQGEVVLVGEAVLSRNVPDITDALRAAVAPAGAVAGPLPEQPKPAPPASARPSARAGETSEAATPAPRPGAALLDPRVGGGRVRL